METYQVKNRPGFDSLYIQMAKLFSERSTCERLSVGCVITSEDYRYVYGIGYNGNASGLPNGCDSSVGAFMPKRTPS